MYIVFNCGMYLKLGEKNPVNLLIVLGVSK